MRHHCGILILAALLSACGQSERADPPAQNYADDSPEALAVASVAARTGLEPTALRVTSSQTIEFPDGSLGCPRPGMAYPQVITPGHRVEVADGTRVFDVRVARGKGRICERPPAD